MLAVGKYSYPNQVTFAEAIEIAKTAITRFDGKMSNVAVAEALGYKAPKSDAISGYIFRKFDDICAYGLMKRQRGFLKVAEVAIQALDPYDTEKAREGKAKAINQMPIVKEAFTQWNGEIPSETALPSKLTDLLGVSWQEAQKHTETLRKLFIELFPYLKSTSETTRSIVVHDHGVGRDEITVEKFETPIGSNELRTEEYGILKIKDEVSVDMAITILKSLKEKLEASKKKDEKTQANNEKG
jgi:hypothetical protein